MEENYIEWLVKRKDPVYAWPVKILMIVVCALSVLAALQMLLGILILAAAAAATYFVFLNLSVEYEYLFADGGFSVDRILGKARRKKAFDCEKEEVQVIAPANSYVLKDYEKQGMKVIDCTSHNAGADVYALIIPVHYRLNLEQVKRMAEAESTEEMLNFAKETRYGKYLQEMEKPNLERVGSMIQENVHRALMRQNPYSAACLEVYLYRKEQEVHRIITAMECVRYGLPAEKIREYLA